VAATAIPGGGALVGGLAGASWSVRSQAMRSMMPMEPRLHRHLAPLLLLSPSSSALLQRVLIGLNEPSEFAKAEPRGASCARGSMFSQEAKLGHLV